MLQAVKPTNALLPLCVGWTCCRRDNTRTPAVTVIVFCDMLQVLFSVMQNFRPEIPPEDELPGKPGPTLPR
jgi:hypothetical protein